MTVKPGTEWIKTRSDQC